MSLAAADPGSMGLGQNLAVLSSSLLALAGLLFLLYVVGFTLFLGYGALREALGRRTTGGGAHRRPVASARS